MLDGVKPDAVFIATPDWTHLAPVMACLDRGIHVHVEKPMTTDEPEAAAIVRKVRETGLKLQVSYNHRWLAPYHAVAEQIHAGKIGRCLTGYARKNNPITVPTKMLPSWARDSSPMWFQSSHDIDLMNWWFDDQPVEAKCYGVKRVLRERFGWDTYDALQGMVRYAGGGFATFEASWVYPEKHPAMPDSFMQQNAGPAASQYDWHSAGRGRLRFELYDCLSYHLFRQLDRQLTIDEEVQSCAGATARIPLLAPAIIFHDNADIESNQGTHISRQRAI